MGVPNLLYAAYRYFTSSQRTVIWKDRPEADVDEPATSAGDSFAPSVPGYDALCDAAVYASHRYKGTDGEG